VRKLAFLALLAGALWLAPGAFAAGWCGSGETAADLPDAVTGQQIHAVVAVPSDGADTFVADASALQDDAAAIDAWWRSQDATRTPRFDQAVFGTATCLDISFVRLSGTGAAYTALGAGGAFDRLISELARTGNTYKDYLVYYDGPSVETNVCGVGGTRAFNTGFSFAVVFMQGCTGVPNSTIAAHELLHALGAVPAGAPHACPGDTAHVCDLPDDLMYPYTSGQPLSQLYLDYNHDDYYGHAGSWPDIQDSAWLHRLDVPEEALNVTLAGAGEIASDIPGVQCTTTCTTQWDQGAAVNLTASPASGERFVRWSGACTGNGLCALKLDQPASAHALFGPLRIPLRVAVTGRGSVHCAPQCTKTFGGGAVLTLRAVPARGWRFARWSGGCSGTAPMCRPKTDFALSVRATFRRR
jgi:List-Bact-rpt repeat protein